MDNERLFQLVQTAILSSTKKPKYMAISTVKTADILGTSYMEVEQGLEELVSGGQLVRSVLEESPHCAIYSLPYH